jgi:hypothetical protein
VTYDISHTTPELPLSIFVSIPAANERHAVLRLAESLIHEAMHLQLTLIETSVPLVRSTSATAFSPWKAEDRPVQGLMHGLYVFAVIHVALGVLMRAAPDTRDYAEARRRDISAEVATMGDGRPGLTSEGAALWDGLLSRFDHQSHQHLRHPNTARASSDAPSVAIAACIPEPLHRAMWAIWPRAYFAGSSLHSFLVGAITILPTPDHRNFPPRYLPPPPACARRMDLARAPRRRS